MMARFSTRADDALLLEWLARRRRGESAASLADRYGTTPQRISTATVRVRAADLAESGEAESVVREGYW